MMQFPSLFPNALTEPNQSSLQQNQPMQTKPGGLFSQQTDNFGTHQPQQPFQQVPDTSYHQRNPFAYLNYYPNQVPATTAPGYNQSIIDQIRACTQSASPIFILPSSPANPNPPCQPIVPPPTCIPYPMPMAIYPPYARKASEKDCKCPNIREKSSRNDPYETSDNDWSSTPKYESMQESWSKHQCKETADGTICARKNCPATIQLQAMISQMLAIQGTIAAAITRMLLKNIDGSGVKDSVDDIMAIAIRCLKQMLKDQLLKESKSSHQLHKLLGLFLTSQSTVPRIIPILTTAQLKTNLLKALVESLINAKIIENQGCYAEAPEAFDALVLELKSENELRELLASLREKECEERLNVGFAANNTQRLIAESRLANVQRKIQQVEREMQRRRDAEGCTDWNKTVGILQRHSAPVPLPQRYDSPDPFVPYRSSNSKRLILKPHVDSPETTYQKPSTKTSLPFCSTKQSFDYNLSDEEKKWGKTRENMKIKSEETNKSECNCQIEENCTMEVEKEVPDDCKIENANYNEYND